MRDNYLFVNVPPNLDLSHDFFEYNPELRYYDCINRLIKNVGPKVASNVMWAIYLVIDPDSKFYAQQFEVRKDNIAKNFLKIPDFNWDDYDYVISCYPDISMSPSKSDYYRIRKLFNRVLDDADGEEINIATNFLSKLNGIYVGLDKAEVRMSKEKQQAKDVRGEEQPGKFAKKH